MLGFYFRLGVELSGSRAHNKSSLNWQLRFEFVTGFEFVCVELEIATQIFTFSDCGFL
jgi:hypothetical protein